MIGPVIRILPTTYTMLPVEEVKNDGGLHKDQHLHGNVYRMAL